MSAKKALTFHVFKGSTLVKSVELAEESVTIGSGPAALLSVDDPSLAELHAVVNVEENGSVLLFDLGSERGTLVNGAQVTNTQLKAGDALTMGDLKIVVTFKTTAAAAVAPAPSNATMAGMLDEETTDPGLATKGRAATPAPAPRAVLQDLREEDDRTDEGELPPPVVASPPPIVASAPKAPTPKPVQPRPEPVVHADAHGEAHDDEEDDGHHGPEEAPEDLIALLVRSSQSDPAMKNRAKILEVNQIWGDALLDAKQFGRRGKVSIGSSVHYPWRVMGIKLVSVPPPLNKVMQFIPPGAASCQSDWLNDFYAPEKTLPSGPNYDLIRFEGGKPVVRAAATWDGFVDIGEIRFNSFDEAVAAGKAKKDANGFEIPMDDDTRVAVDIDGMIFFAQMVHPGRKAIARMTENIDYPFIAIAAMAMFFFAILAFLVLLTPYDSKTSEVTEIDDRYVELLMEKPEPEKKKGGNPDAGEGAKAKKEEGKVGKKDAKMDKAKGNKVEMKKQEIDRQIVDQSGIMGAMNDDALSSALGATGLSSDLQGGIGGLIGASGTQIGSGGLGARGSGIGGGGTAEGLGGLGTKGMGSGASGFGSGGGSFGQKGEGGIAGVGGDPIILGALDRSLIDEVIKRHMNQIRYCYQRELTKSSTLAGKIVIKFTIAKDGTVSSASTKSTTMSNAAVEQCIEGRFMRMVFPQPKGGGVVIVSYPFMFSPG